MRQQRPPAAKFERFERVTVTGGERHRGQRGTILWRDWSAAGRGRWLYVVHLREAARCPTFSESDLSTEGRFDDESDHLGRGAEVSFDIVLEADNAFVEGCYRLPGRYWEVMVFRKADVPQLHRQAGRWDSGITGTCFSVPASAKLDRDFVLRALGEAFGHADWAQVEGPDSMVLR